MKYIIRWIDQPGLLQTISEIELPMGSLPLDTDIKAVNTLTSAICFGARALQVIADPTIMWLNREKTKATVIKDGVIVEYKIYTRVYFLIAPISTDPANNPVQRSTTTIHVDVHLGKQKGYPYKLCHRCGMGTLIEDVVSDNTNGITTEITCCKCGYKKTEFIPVKLSGTAEMHPAGR